VDADTEIYPPFLGSELRQPAPEDARFHVLPVPWERTVSYGGGTAMGPSAILRASWQLELLDGQDVPASEGIYTHPPVDVSGEPGQVLERIASAVGRILDLGKTPIVLGGEHTVTYGVIQGYLNAGHRDIGVVQLDAHADLRDTYEGDPFSHACVMRRVVELGIPLFQLGVRAMSEEERDARLRYSVASSDAEELVPSGVAEAALPDDFPSHVFFTLDVDGIDPSVFPATGTPVPGGPGWYQTLSLFASIARQRRIVGFDLMELAPIPGFHCYDFAAALLVYKLMGIVRCPVYPRHG
jgi:agmatinase